MTHLHEHRPPRAGTGETLLSTKIFDVERRTYALRDGRTIQRDVVVHPGAVVIIPVIDDGIVMVHNFRIAAGGELLELPAGTLAPPEPPIQAAARELEEETGYVAATIEPFIQFYASPGFCTELMHIFVARDMELRRQRLEADEQIRVEILPVERARRAVVDGTIRDAKSIAALAAWFLTSDARP
ncbi:MAG: NUDIX hydrolase [Phycisphaerales bacterium]|nr:NUDIX hydrolase [Phycisphaerales bacterium]